MGWVDQVAGHVVALDAAPLIYFAEEHPRYLPHIEPFFVALDKGQVRAVVSTIVLAEVLVHPLRHNALELVQRYRTILLESGSITTIAVSSTIAEQAARLRAHWIIKTPDALHLATAVHASARFFLTNDRRLPALPVLTIIALDDL